MPAGDRFRVAPANAGVAGVVWLCDGRGRVYESRSVLAQLARLESLGEDLAAWRVWWVPDGSIGWRSACLASDAGDVFGV